jgi:Integrase core domain
MCARSVRRTALSPRSAGPRNSPTASWLDRLGPELESASPLAGVKAKHLHRLCRLSGIDVGELADDGRLRPSRGLSASRRSSDVASGCRPQRGVAPCASPVDGPGRFGIGQRRGGELQLHARARAGLSRRHFATKDQARREVARFIDSYNHRRRHSSCEMLPPVAYEQALAQRAAGRLRGDLSRMKPASQLAPDPGDRRWHQDAGEREAQSAISNPPRFRGKPNAGPVIPWM